MNQQVFTRRVYIAGGLVALIAFVFVFRLGDLHFSPRIQISPQDDRPVRRGLIRDRMGDILALSIERESLFANPMEVARPVETAAALADLIDLPRDVLVERLSRPKRFVWIKRRLDDETAAKVRKLSLKGLHLRKEYQRVYPNGPLASNITGFVGIDNRGLEGMEYKFDDILTGKRERPFDRDEADVIRASSITLTIDRVIQYQAERELEWGVRRADGRQGAAVVMEVKTGRILALAKYPPFDPNNYSAYTDENRKNFSIVDSFEPGSTLKVIAMAALLEFAPSAQNELYSCDGKIDIADATIKCTGEHGKLNLDGIIKNSCNVGIIQAMKHVSKDQYHQMLARMGFGKPTGSDFPGETEGILYPSADWSGLSKYSMSIGQEISVSSLQLTAAFAAIANRGVYVVPSIIEKIERENGTVSQNFFARTKGPVLSEEVAARLLKMMRGVVDGGTGAKGALAAYEVAGKTGTSQKSMKRGGYYSDRYTVVFAGIVPYQDPELCITVVIDEPVNYASGGEGAAPVFTRIASRALPLLGVKSKQLQAEEPLASRPSQKQPDGKRVPDFRGMLLSESLRTLAQLQLIVPVSYTLTGTGRVYKQSPEPGSALKPNQAITLQLNDR
ncbi:MAG: PASTA domain-containing protein [Spirochaetes bacterium]|nr:MAG: PASTA domain-containing protein [Spirochaetota bacterium]